ncbi:tat pathway signal sequence [Colletotrichum navitas]|uniref:1-alkyl-2-acetylglycerophosphocholine esterase n=1 Tax=Colletotrichum navitas TaxID=681940 RepID=A0AAD8V2Q0_9PEZI|nr:tat pathway signal sequence [Colletotrichum navitas]KAK1579938.1 tat pathway signal sequence [Colletotrichum navitas]
MIFSIFLALASVAAAVVIPGPPGPHPVALKVRAFEDAARWDPHAPKDRPEKRRVMISVNIPIKKEIRCSAETVPYMPPITTSVYGEMATEMYGLPDTLFSGLELEFCHAKAPCASKADKYPLIVFSPGRALTRLAYGVLARSLASYGYIVVTVDHTYDATVVEFPDGSVRYAENATNSDRDYVETLLDSRQKDVSFVINQLLDTSAVSSLMTGTQVSIDPGKVFVAGHSLGGATAAASLYADDRVLGGLNFDGLIIGPVATEGTHKPLVLVGTPTSTDYVPGWNETWPNLRGPSLMLAVAGTTHLSFFDIAKLLTVLALPAEYDELIEEALGPIQSGKLEKIKNELLLRTLDFVLENKKDALCGIESLGPGVKQLLGKNLSCP